MRQGRHIERRNPIRSKYLNNQVECGVCGRHSNKFRLMPQRNKVTNEVVLVDRTHLGCVNTPNIYQGILTRGPHYGGS